MDRSERPSDDHVGSRPFAPSPPEQMRAVQEGRGRAARVGALVTCLVFIVGVVAMRLRSTTSTDVMGAAPGSSVPPSSTISFDWDCVELTFWDVADGLQKRRAQTQDTAFDEGTVVMIGRVGPEVHRTTTSDTRTSLTFERTEWSFDAWRPLYPQGSSAAIGSVTDVRAYRTDAPGTAEPCDNINKPTALTDGAVIVSVFRHNNQTSDSWVVASSEDSVFYVRLNDGTAPRSPAELEDPSLTVQTAGHGPACRQHPTCTLGEFWKELDGSTAPS